MFGAFNFGEPYLGQDKSIIAQVKRMLIGGIKLSALVGARAIDLYGMLMARVRLRP